MTDIPIQRVRMVWDTKPPEDEPCIKLYRHVGEYDDRYTSSWDIVTEQANRDDGSGPVQHLLERFVHLAVLEKIHPAEIHAALLVVPEYRAALVQAGTIHPRVG